MTVTLTCSRPLFSVMRQAGPSPAKTATIPPKAINNNHSFIV